jgi:hypothetical protein
MWSSSAISIGFTNRLFVVGADRKEKVSWPEPPDKQRLDKIRLRISDQLSRLPFRIGITPEAKKLWDEVYKSLPASEHSNRIDTIGMRLLALIAFTTDKKSIDKETVSIVSRIMTYELAMRRQVDPLDCDNTVARLEEKIRRKLAQEPITERDLKRLTNANRTGLWAFESALRNLVRAGEVVSVAGTWQLVSSVLSSGPFQRVTQ